MADPNQFALATRLAQELEIAGHDNIHTGVVHTGAVYANDCLV